MIRLTCCHRANHAGEYFRLQLQGGDAIVAPIQIPLALQAQWVGSALADVGLGPFTPPTAIHLVRLARGRHPVEKTPLAPAINRTRAYYDLTITAPKTVSLAALVQPDHPTARKVIKAHVLAVHRVAEEVGRWMIRGQSQTAPAAAKWLGAIFGHTHTREGDPHLHSHLIVPNLMHNQAGQWRALQIDIEGRNRLRLGLLYAHELTRNLRRAGLGSELMMSPQAAPALRSLHPMVRIFSTARAKVLLAALAAEAALPARNPARSTTSEVLPAYPEHPDRAALRRRQQLADQIRQRKPRLADDPITLDHEARRWTGRLTKAQLLTLHRVLALGDNRAGHRHPGPENIPPLDMAFVRAACRRLPEDTRQTDLIVFQALVRASAGRHAWEDLRQVCRAYLDARSERWQKLRTDLEALAVQAQQVRSPRAAAPAHLPTVPPSSLPTEPARRPLRRGR